MSQEIENTTIQLEVKNLTKKYLVGEQEIFALKGVDLKIHKGEFVAIMGPSGSGKSTLMQILGLLDKSSSGDYKINGELTSNLDDNQVAHLRSRYIGFIFQQFNLLSRFNALENVSLPLLYSKGEVTHSYAESLLNKVGLSLRMHNKPNQMSGGQQQRVAIARSLINNPEIIFADEPTGNLDSQSEHEIIEILKKLNESGITIVIVTHEESVAQQAKRIIRFKDGLLVYDSNSVHSNVLSLNSYSNQIDQIEKQNILSTQNLNSNSLTYSKTQSFSLVKDLFKSHDWSYLKEHINQSVKSLFVNKIRTLLSLLGILIGVGSLILMLALGTGAKQSMADQLANLGSNLIVVKSGADIKSYNSQANTNTKENSKEKSSHQNFEVATSSNVKLNLSDVQILREEVENIKNITSVVQNKNLISYHDRNFVSDLMGVNPYYASLHNLEVDYGRFFTIEENLRQSRVVVLGYSIAKKLFGELDPINEILKINKINFKVIGVLPERGMSGDLNLDDAYFVPIQTALKRIVGKDVIDAIEIEVEHAELTEDVMLTVKELLLNRHKIKDSQREVALDIKDMTAVKETLAANSTTMSLLLMSLSFISLVVGGIGIMNIMLVTVTERTREIGLRKAIGAKRSDIATQFLVESVVLSSLGGGLGIILGILLAFVVSFIFSWSIYISIFSIILSFGFSFIVGVVFGLYPAKKASLLSPIEALRTD